MGSMANSGVIPAEQLRDRYRQHDKFRDPKSVFSIALNGSLLVPLVEPLFCDRWVSSEDPQPNLQN